MLLPVGHEVIVYRDKSVIASDTSLWLLRHWFLISCSSFVATSKEHEEILLELRRYFEQWEWLGPGVITGIDLDAILPENSPERRGLYLQLVRSVESLIGRYGQTIPLDYLERNITVAEGIHFASETPTAPLLRTLAKLVELVEPTLP